MIASLICVYNDYQKLSSQLLQSIEKQKESIEVILVDNTNGEYKCSVDALRYGVSKCSTDVYVFVHQDISIKEDEGLISFVRAIKNGKVGDIFGVAGAIECERKNIGLYTSGEKYSEVLLECEWKLKKVSCVDECMFGMKKETYDEHPFDRELCDDWHLYCAEMCMNARKNGANVWVVPIQIHHYSSGTISVGYMKCLRNIAAKYSRDFKFIWTTAYKVRSNRVYMDLLLLAWTLNRKLIRKER